LTAARLAYFPNRTKKPHVVLGIGRASFGGEVGEMASC